MPLTGIEIFKLLPKTNCGDCGVPTCLAFAMKLATEKAELKSCPFVSEAAREQLAQATAPPIRVVNIGTDQRAFKVGGETVLFRHEKRFENQPGIAILISDMMPEQEIDARIKRFSLHYERVGVDLHADLIAAKADSGNSDKFCVLVAKIKQNSDAGMILISESAEMLGAALKICAGRKPILYAANSSNWEKIAAMAKQYSCPLVVKANNLEGLAELTGKLDKAGVKDIVLDAGSRSLRRAFEDQVNIRSLALGKHRAFGYPTIAFPCEMTDDAMKEALIASVFIAKYASIIVLSDFQGETLFNLLLERMGIYSDPQRPLTTKEGIYEIGQPDKNSPVLITSNFSLTYFIVSGEIETSRVPSYLLVKDTEGLSVMTAWAAGKFTADNIAAFVKRSGIESKVAHRKLIIPGYASMESGSLEEELPGWQIQVGPREGAHIPAYLKIWKP